MRGVTLGILLAELKAECGFSQNQAHGINNRDSLVQVLQRTQRRLWASWDWPHLRVERFLVLQAGQRFYSVPSDLAYDRIDLAQVKFGGQWQNLQHGITNADYSIFDPRVNDRSWPAMKWDITEDPADSAGTPDDYGMIEIWPLPSDSGVVGADQEGNVCFTGVRQLLPLETETQRADLDNDLLVLYAAAEILARDRKDDATAKGQQALQLFMQLKGNQDKQRSFVMGGADPMEPRPVVIHAHPVPWSVRKS